MPNPAKTKFTVYCENHELLGIDRALLDLRENYGIKIDRGRFVLEAIQLATIPGIAARIAEAN